MSELQVDLIARTLSLLARGGSSRLVVYESHERSPDPRLAWRAFACIALSALRPAGLDEDPEVRSVLGKLAADGDVTAARAAWPDEVLAPARRALRDAPRSELERALAPLEEVGVALAQHDLFTRVDALLARIAAGGVGAREAPVLVASQCVDPALKAAWSQSQAGLWLADAAGFAGTFRGVARAIASVLRATLAAVPVRAAQGRGFSPERRALLTRLADRFDAARGPKAVREAVYAIDLGSASNYFGGVVEDPGESLVGERHEWLIRGGKPGYDAAATLRLVVLQAARVLAVARGARSVSAAIDRDEEGAAELAPVIRAAVDANGGVDLARSLRTLAPRKAR